MKLSLIVPIYKKALYVEQSLRGIVMVLDELIPQDYEIIPVVDGSPDKSALQVALMVDQFPAIIKPIYKEVNEGKGAAIHDGIEVAKGQYIGFMDCGADISPASLVYFVNQLHTQPDAVVANRYLKESVYKANISRKLFSAGFSILRGLLFTTSHPDTQVGLKVYRGDFLKAVVNHLQEDRWLVDIELFLWLRHLGLTNIKQVPVILDMMKEQESQSATIRGIVRIMYSLVTLSARLGRLSLFSKGFAAVRSGKKVSHNIDNNIN